MANKKIIALLFGLHILLPMRVSCAGLPDESTTIADLTSLQQQIVRLKFTIERLKLQQELSRLEPHSKHHTHNICQFGAEGLGSLTLTALYSLAGQRFALVTYNPDTSLEVKAGDHLLCGEVIRSISSHQVEVEKQGQRYQLLGAGIPATSPLPYRSPQPPERAKH